MILRRPAFFLASLVFATVVLHGAPTEVRDWTSVTGSKVRGRVTGVENGIAMLESNFRVIKVPLEKLSADDRLILEILFPAGEKASSENPAATAAGKEDSSIQLEKGKAILQTVGPGSSYWLYIPKSLPAGRKHPLLMVLSPHKGSAGNLNPYIPGAERNGWIVMNSVESSNDQKWEDKEKSVNSAIAHAMKLLPVDPKRLFFSGFSGGSWSSFEFADLRKDVAGVLATGMGASGKKNISAKMPIYFVNGTNCWNRGDVGSTIAELCPRSKDSFIRFFVGKHAPGNAEMFEDGITHLNHVVMCADPGAYREEAAANEAAILSFADSLKSRNPARALMWTTFLKARPVDSRNAAAIHALDASLRTDQAAVAWNEDRAILQAFLVNEMGKEMLRRRSPWASFNKDFKKLESQIVDPEWKRVLVKMQEESENPH